MDPVTLGLLGALSIPAARYAPQIGRGAQSLWRLGKNVPSFMRGAVRDPSGTARRIWDPIMGGGGWGRSTIPRQAATVGKAAKEVPIQRARGQAFNQPPLATRTTAKGTKVPISPGTRTIPAVPGRPELQAGWARRHPWLASAGLGGAGMTIGAMMQGDPEAEETGAVPPVAVGGPPIITGQQPAADKWSTDLPTLIERKQKERRHFNKNMKMILGHSMLLSFQNPSRKNDYISNAIEMLKADAASRGSVEDAKIIEEVFKDKKVPKTAKTLYNRLVNHMSPKEAAAVSGYTLEIEKTEAKSYADLLKAQADLRGKRPDDIVMMEEIRSIAQYDINRAVTMLVDAWTSGKTLKLSDIYSGISASGKTVEEMKQMARQLLLGTSEEGAQSGGIPENQTVGTITAVD